MGQMHMTDAGLTRQDNFILPALFIASIANIAWYPTKHSVFIGKIKKDALSYHHPNQGNVQASDIVKTEDMKVSL